MKIALVAATGKIGSHIAQRALKRGHAVTAIVRSARELPPELAGARLVVAPIEDAAALADAVRGHDVLVSAFGSPEGAPIAAAAPRIVAAARAAGVKRVLWVGGAGNLLIGPGKLLRDAPAFPAAYLPYALAHGEALDALRAADDLDWTFYAPAAEIGPGDAIGTFRTGKDALIAEAGGRSRISYPDYAQAFVDEIESPRYVKQVATAAY